MACWGVTACRPKTESRKCTEGQSRSLRFFIQIRKLRSRPRTRRRPRPYSWSECFTIKLMEQNNCRRIGVFPGTERQCTEDDDYKDENDSQTSEFEFKTLVTFSDLHDLCV